MRAILNTEKVLGTGCTRLMVKTVHTQVQEDQASLFITQKVAEGKSDGFRKPIKAVQATLSKHIKDKG